MRSAVWPAAYVAFVMGVSRDSSTGHRNVLLFTGALVSAADRRRSVASQAQRRASILPCPFARPLSTTLENTTSERDPSACARSSSRRGAGARAACTGTGLGFPLQPNVPPGQGITPHGAPSDT